jgi:superfamily II DNA or RNA helicase
MSTETTGQMMLTFDALPGAVPTEIAPSTPEAPPPLPVVPPAPAPASASFVARLGAGSDWGDETPRRWQVDAMASLGTVQPGERGVVTAVMGAGKARFAVELARRAMSEGVPVVLSTSTVALVEQLSADVSNRLGAGSVGRYYTHGADIEHPVIVTCIPSMPDLARELRRIDRERCFWIADEAHKTECEAAVTFAGIIDPVGAVGLSATPYRASESARLTLWDREVYRYGFGDAIRDGVLVPFRLHFPQVPVETTEDLDEVCADWIGRQPGCGIADARNIADAVRFAARLSDAGVAALPIHSQMTGKAQRAALARLRAGDLRCLVHVQMLTEGVDIPFLTWGCLRRKRGSRVANAQHVGRYLRAYPGKTHADLFDPWEILPSFGLDSPAALGEALEQFEEVSPELEPEDETDAATGEKLKKPTKVERIRMARMGAATGFLAAAAASLRAAGMADAAWGSGTWRDRPATAKQVSSLDRLTGRTGQGGMAYALRQERVHPAAQAVGYCAGWYAAHPSGAKLRSGVLSDLQTVIYACHRDKVAATCAVLERFGVDPEPVLSLSRSVASSESAGGAR